MPATIRQIVDDALQYVGEVAGAGTQQFSDDRMFKDAIRGFNLVFKKYHWHQYRKWFRLQLDGVLGIVSTDAFEQVIDFEDFISVHRDTEDNQLPILPKSRNPYTITGTQVRFWTGLHVTDTNYVKRKLQFFPVTATGFVNVLARVYPLVPPALEWDWEDTMYFDKDLLVYATAFATLIGDDLNAGAANAAKSLMEMKYDDIVKGLAGHPIPLNNAPPIPNTWGEQIWSGP